MPREVSIAKHKMMTGKEICIECGEEDSHSKDCSLYGCETCKGPCGGH